MVNVKFANLHFHSTYSDAQFTPEQLVLIGKSIGYRALALTDHDTDGGVKPMMEFAKKEGIDVISGCEFTGVWNDEMLHLTALDYDMENPVIRNVIDSRTAMRTERTHQFFNKACEAGYIDGITWDDIVRVSGKGTWICYDTVVMACSKFNVPIKAGMRDAIFNSAEVKASLSATPPPDRAHTAPEIIKAVREAGGVIALAHPYHWTQYVPDLVKYGLNGIEVDQFHNYENTSFLALEMAHKYNLYHCGGTDHGGPMSGNGGEYAKPSGHGVTEEEYYTLKERLRG